MPGLCLAGRRALAGPVAVCLIAFSWDGLAPARRLLLAANRDEFWDRPTLPLHRWELHGKAILAGRDARAGGSWLGFSDAGRVAMLTNVRPAAAEPERPRSRGELVSRWLAASGDLADFLGGLQAQDFGGFNLVLGDARWARWIWLTNSEAAWSASLLSGAEPQAAPDGWRIAALAAGVHALSNAGLDTPWPKARRLAQALSGSADGAAHDHGPAQTALQPVLAVLGDGHGPLGAVPTAQPFIDRDGPPAPFCDPFVHWPERRYGTRSSLLAQWIEAGGGRLDLQEWTHGPGDPPPARSGVWPQGQAYRRASISMWGMPTSS